MTRFLLLLLIVLAAGCRGPLLVVDVGPIPDAGSSGGRDASDSGATVLELVRVLPSHGPFSGGNLVVLRGAGFTNSAIGVTIDGAAVPPADVRRIDPNRLEVRMPPHAPGAVTVEVDDGITQRSLENAYTYDAVGLSPQAGPPAGGTRLRITAASDTFAAGLGVTLDGAPCTDIRVLSPTEASCRTPMHPLGVVDVVLDTGASDIVLRDAFTYENPFRAFGGLGGGPLDGTLTVLVRGLGQAPLQGALVFAGRNGVYSYRAITGPDGTVVFSGDDLRGRVDVFASHPCYHHAGFIGLDATYVTAGLRLAYLSCVEGGGSGGGGPSTKSLSGELVFYDGVEFPEPTFEWRGVPEPGPGEERVAYVGIASGRNLFNGDGTSAQVSPFQRVTESDRGTLGYRYTVREEREGGAMLQSVVAYAIAGIEGPLGFTPYVAGLSRPVVPRPAMELPGVDVRMDTLLAAGRRISSEVPTVGPVYVGGFGTFAPGTLDQLRVLVRYSAPGIAAGLPLFGNRSDLGIDDLTGNPLGLDIPLQPTREGSFAEAEQELFVILTSSAVSNAWYQQPHTRLVVRSPLAVDQVQVSASAFLGIPNFTVPSTPGLVIADRTLRWELASEGASLQRIQVTPPRGAVYYIIAHPSARALTLPDLQIEPGFEFLQPGTLDVTTGVYDIAGLDFDRIDTRVLDSLAIRRSSFNQTQFTAE
jgi:hypothetical protein